MLVLTRKDGQAIVIGGNIRVTVISTDRRGRAVLGVEAPADVLVLREELVGRKAPKERTA